MGLHLFVDQPGSDKPIYSKFFFFFEKSIESKKSAEGRNPWYTKSIQRGLGGRGEEREKIRKTNHLRGQPPRSPSERVNKNKWRSSSWDLDLPSKHILILNLVFELVEPNDMGFLVRIVMLDNKAYIP
jgi:hypothetical protein